MLCVSYVSSFPSPIAERKLLHLVESNGMGRRIAGNFPLPSCPGGKEVDQWYFPFQDLHGSCISLAVSFFILLLFAIFTDAESNNADAISKFEEILSLDPSKQNTLWCLGNAHSSLGFLTSDTDEAKPHFDEAAVFYRRAVDEVVL